MRITTESDVVLMTAEGRVVPVIKRLDELEDGLKQCKADLAKGLGDLQTELNLAIEDNTEAIADVSDRVDDLRDALAETDAEVASNVDAILELQGEDAGLADAISDVQRDYATKKLLQESEAGILKTLNPASQFAKESDACHNEGKIYSSDLDKCLTPIAHAKCNAAPVGVKNSLPCPELEYLKTCALKCKPGYRPNPARFYKCNEDANLVPVKAASKCDDINECQTNKGGCQHACTNTVGSFKCRCPSGQALNPDGKTCTAMKLTFLAKPFNIRQSSTSSCRRITYTLPSSIPSGATAVLGAVTTFNSCRGDHVVYSMGRNNVRTNPQWSQVSLPCACLFRVAVLGA